MTSVDVRSKPRYAHAKLDDRQIAAAYELYKSGRSTEDIAREIWERFGFKHQNCCAVSLRHAFRRAGYPMRDQRAGRLAYLSRKEAA